MPHSSPHACCFTSTQAIKTVVLTGRTPPERKVCFVRFDPKTEEFQLGADTRCDGRRINAKEAGDLYEAGFLALVRTNAGVWLPDDSHIFLKMQATEVAPRQYTYHGFVRGGHSYNLPTDYVARFFKSELMRNCKDSCGKPIPCSDAGQAAAPGGGEVSDGATATSAVVRPPVAYPQHNNNYCVSFSLASALCAAGDTASAAAIAALAQQIVELPAGSDRVAWLRHDCNQRLQPRWQTRKLKSVGQLNASAFLALLRAAADGTVTVFQIQDSCGNVQHCAAAVAGWLLDPNKAHALPLSDGGLDACCLGDARFAFVVNGFQLLRDAPGTKRAAPDGEDAPAAKKLRRCASCEKEKLSDQFSKRQLKKQVEARCRACAPA